MTTMKLTAGSPFPCLTVKKLGGGDLSLGALSDNGNWQMVVIYRGKHCPLCTGYLKQINEALPQLEELKIDVVAVSADPEEKAKAQMGAVEPKFPVGYGLSIDQMKELGLYISNPRSPEETDIPFAEPGLFVINDKGLIQIIDISNAPFARPSIETLLRGFSFIKNPENNYPIRGTHK